MAITLDVTSIRQNNRGLYFEFVGDGSTTAITVPHGRFIRPDMTVTAVVVTAPTGIHSSDSRGGGHNFPTGGTNAAVTSATVSGANVVVTNTAAVANGTRAYANVVFGLHID